MWRYEDLNNDNVDVIFDKLKNNDSLLDRVGNNGPELTDEFIEKEWISGGGSGRDECCGKYQYSRGLSKVEK